MRSEHCTITKNTLSRAFDITSMMHELYMSRESKELKKKMNDKRQEMLHEKSLTAEYVIYSHTSRLLICFNFSSLKCLIVFMFPREKVEMRRSHVNEVVQSIRRVSFLQKLLLYYSGYWVILPDKRPL